MTEDLQRDLRLSFRAFSRRPGFHALLVLTLSLGIGANATVWSVVETVLLRPLPYEDPERLVVIRTELPESGTSTPRSSGPEILDLRQGVSSFRSVGGIWARPAALTDETNEPEEIEMGFVTAGFLSVLGIEPLSGRDIAPEEDVPNAEGVVVLSHGLWQRRYGADPEIVGQTISMDGEPLTVVGVLRDDFRTLLPPEAGVPDTLQAFVPWGGGYDELSRSFRVFTVVARLEPDARLENAAAELRTLAARLVSDYPEDYQRSGLALHLESLHRAVTAPSRVPLTVVWATVSFVLLVAGANVLNLLLVRASGSESETVVKRALGASRASLIRPVLVETALLSLAGGGLGFLLARFGVSLLKWLAPGEVPRLDDVSVGSSSLVFLSIVSLGLGLGLGLVTALYLTRSGRNRPLRRSLDDAGGHRIRGVLVASEVALSLVLLVGTGLLVRSFRALSVVSLGYQTDGVATLKLSLIDSAYPYTHPEKIARFYRDLLLRIGELPGVGAAGATTQLPLDGASSRMAPYSYESEDGIVEWDTVAADYRTVTPGWLEALSVPLLEGRLFEWTDDHHHPSVVVVDEELARTAWPGESAVGKRLKAVVFWNGELTPTWCEVVGVVAHVRHHPGSTGAPQIFLSHQQSPQRTMALAIQTRAPLATLGRAIGEEVRALEPTQPVHSLRLMDEYRSESVSTHRFTMVMLSVFSAGALVLAALGIYGVVAFTVSRRKAEIGLRMALGAGPARIRNDVLSAGLWLVGPGVVLGVAASLFLSPLLSSLLFGVTASDPMTFICIPIFVVTVALAACVVPGRRASALDPVAALRDE
jgi:predicted permease